MEKNIIDEILNEITLDDELRIINEFSFIDLLSELGYRKDKMWTDKEENLLSKLVMFALKTTKWQLEVIQNYYNLKDVTFFKKIKNSEQVAIDFTTKKLGVISNLLSEDYKIGYKEGIEHFLKHIQDEKD